MCDGLGFRRCQARSRERSRVQSCAVCRGFGSIEYVVRTCVNSVFDLQTSLIASRQLQPITLRPRIPHEERSVESDDYSFQSIHKQKLRGLGNVGGHNSEECER
jgi:hypothetical protein